MSEKLNVLFIITDQHRADHLGCAGNKILKTPNIDSLAKKGVSFTRAYCADPMCMPNRATIFTGKYPNVHGVRCNGINLNPESLTLAEVLRKSGYVTSSIGKIHFQHYSPPFKRKAKSLECITDWMNDKKREKLLKIFTKPYYGFEHVKLTVGHGDIVTGHYYNWLKENAPKYLPYLNQRLEKWQLMKELYLDTELYEEVFPTSYITQMVTNFLENYSSGGFGDRPFFLHCSFPDPHHPATPPGIYKKMYNPDDVQLPENFHDEENLTNHPFMSQHLREESQTGDIGSLISEDEVRKFIAHTYGAISMIDDGIGQILSSLEKLGLSKNTIVLFTSDHGELMGDHGLATKGPFPFQGILRVPLIWKVPEMARNAISYSLVSSVDIPTTIMKLLEIEHRAFIKDLQGCDLSPVLKNPNLEIRDCCLVEEDEEGGFLRARLRHLITKNYKLSIYEGLEDHGDLFDLKKDPNETNNLWYNPDFKDIRNNLMNKMFHEFLKVQSRYPKKQAYII